jgi:peptidoglycan pentaglycine glycine transferase (the first glycine)
MKLLTQTIKDRASWNATLALLPYAHVLQTWEWGDFKAETTGWRPHRVAFMHRGDVVGMAQILTRQQGPFRVMYVPKGPALDYTNPDLRKSVVDELKRYARENKAIFIKIDPDVIVGTGVPGEPDSTDAPLGLAVQQEWHEAGLRFSDEQVQFRNSQIIDLRPPEDDILMAMKSKTRYNVRLASRKGVKVRFGGVEDLDLLYDLYVDTARRDDFVIRPLPYYRQAWGSFMRAGLAQPLIAEYKDKMLAHIIIFGFGKRAWYFYGASSDGERNRMPTYALQWEAIRWAKAQNMAVYDLWGAPDDFHDPDDPLAGVFRFKEGFGGTVVRRIGAWDYPANERLYDAYTRLKPAAIGALRWIARRRLQRSDQGA